MNEICKGCRDNADGICLPITSTDHQLSRDQLNECPCQECLIKGICTNGCKDYNIYVNQIEKEIDNE